jgi:bacteriocin-like protein
MAKAKAPTKGKAAKKDKKRLSDDDLKQVSGGGLVVGTLATKQPSKGSTRGQ